MLTTLDLFAGIGGFALGLEATGFFTTSCFVENEPYCQAVLRHHWPDVPILGDIRDVRRPDLPDPDPDVICGGFPCQPFSNAGKRGAQSDSRHLWPEMFRLIGECRPSWVIGENVTGIINLGLDEVLADLEGEGYATRTFVIPACAVGAPHIRQRIWVIANADSDSEPDGTFDGNAGQRQLGFGFVADAQHTGEGQRSSGESRRCRQSVADTKEVHGQWSDIQGGQQRQDKGTLGERSTVMADAKSAGSETRPTNGVGITDKPRRNKGQSKSPRGQERVMADAGRNAKSAGSDTQLHGNKAQRGKGKLQSGDGDEDVSHYGWEFEPNVGRLAHGIPARVSQLRALGNAIVPQIAKEIGNAIKTAETTE